MKLIRIGTLAALGFAGAAIPDMPKAAEPGDRRPLVGTWNLAAITEEREDVTGEHRGELWIFSEDGRFERVSPRGESQGGGWALDEGGKELQVVVADRGGEQHAERYPVIAVSAEKLELLEPAEVEGRVIIHQDRFAAFFHS